MTWKELLGSISPKSLTGAPCPPLARPLHTHHDLEGAVGDVLPPEAHTDDVFPRLWGGVEDVEGAVGVFHHVHVGLGPVGRPHGARHFARPRRLRVHRQQRLLPQLDGGAQPRACHEGGSVGGNQGAGGEPQEEPLNGSRWGTLQWEWMGDPQWESMGDLQ